MVGFVILNPQFPVQCCVYLCFLFCPRSLTDVFSFLVRFTACDYLFGILKRFFKIINVGQRVNHTFSQLRADDEKKVMSIRLYLFSWMTIVSPYCVFRWPCKLCNIEILSCIVPIPLFWQRSMSYCLHLHLFLRLINLHSRYAQRFRASKQLKLVAIKTQYFLYKLTHIILQIKFQFIANYIFLMNSVEQF